MRISQRQFVVRFLLSGFVFLFLSTTLLGTTGPRGFPQSPDSILRTGSDSPIAWKRVASHVVLPIKSVLLGPLTPYFNVLDEDPPPPFIWLGIVIYWTLLAAGFYGLMARMLYLKQ